MCKKYSFSNIGNFSKNVFEKKMANSQRKKPTLIMKFSNQIYFSGSVFKLYWSINTRTDPKLSETSRKRYFEKMLTLMKWEKLFVLICG